MSAAARGQIHVLALVARQNPPNSTSAAVVDHAATPSREAHCLVFCGDDPRLLPRPAPLGKLEIRDGMQRRWYAILLDKHPPRDVRTASTSTPTTTLVPPPITRHVDTTRRSCAAMKRSKREALTPHVAFSPLLRRVFKRPAPPMADSPRTSEQRRAR